MAVNFDLLPQEDMRAIPAPSVLLWCVVFVLIWLGGAAAVLLLWPKSVPTQTVKFWITLIGGSGTVAALVVLVRYFIYEHQKSKIARHNRAVQLVNDHVLEVAGMPLALLGCAYRISADQNDHCADAIGLGKLSLATHQPFAEGGKVVKARWLAVPGMQVCAGNEQDDLVRRRGVAAWLFEQLLGDLTSALNRLPTQVPLAVELFANNDAESDAYLEVWSACWREKISRSAGATTTHMLSPSPGLMMLDGWMDELIGKEKMCAKLLVGVQLNPLLAQSPPSGAAEAGVAVLLMPQELARPQEMQAQCYVYRPVRGAADSPKPMLEHALRYGTAGAEEITTAWHVGTTPEQRASLRGEVHEMDFNPQVANLDLTVGNTGCAAPWLALACAATLAHESTTAQMLFTGQQGAMNCLMMKSGTRTRRSA